MNTDVCDRLNNAEITVIAKVFLIQGDPAGGAKKGTANDADTNSQNIIKWDTGSWNIWKQKFASSAMTFHGKFWLVNNHKWNEYEDRTVKYFPNIWCGLKIEFAASAATAHHSITVYRVPRSGRGFRSNFSLMDSYDVELQKKGSDSAGKVLRQKPAVHELFHTLGVRHIDHGEATCPIGDSGNANPCYGDTDDDRHTLMGSAMNVHEKFADPWRRAAVKLTGKGAVGTATDWQAKLKRHYPRTQEEVDRDAQITHPPIRK